MSQKRIFAKVFSFIILTFMFVFGITKVYVNCNNTVNEDKIILLDVQRESYRDITVTIMDSNISFEINPEWEMSSTEYVLLPQKLRICLQLFQKLLE